MSPFRRSGQNSAEAAVVMRKSPPQRTAARFLPNRNNEQKAVPEAVSQNPDLDISPKVRTLRSQTGAERPENIKVLTTKNGLPIGTFMLFN